MQGVEGAYPGDCLDFTTEPARKRAFNALNSLSVQVNECQRLSEDVSENLRLCGDPVISPSQMEPNSIISDDWSVSLPYGFPLPYDSYHRGDFSTPRLLIFLEFSETT